MPFRSEENSLYGDEYLGTQRKRLSTILLGAIIVAGIITGVINLVFFDDAQIAAGVLFGMAVTGGAGLYLISIGKRRLACAIALSAVIFALNFNLIDGNGVNDPGSIALPIVIIIGGMLYGEKSVVPLTFISLLSLILVSLLEYSGYVQSDYPADLDDVLVRAAILLSSGLVIWALVHAYEKNIMILEKALRELHEHRLEIGKSLAEKEILIKEIHHRVKNNMQIMASLLNLEAVKTSTDGNREVFEESQYMIHAMAQVHEKLYHSESLNKINIQGLYRDLISNYMGELSHKAGLIHIEDLSDEIYININQAIPFSLLLNELIINSLKHGFNNMETGTILIKAGLDRGSIILDVEDNGAGFSEGFFSGAGGGLGMELIHNLVEQLGGTIRFENREGACIRAQFPQAQSL